MAYPDFDPLWATNDTYLDGVTPNKIRPDESLRDYGYLPDAEPTAQELNWQLNNLHLQIAELKTIALGAYETPVNELKYIVGDSRNPTVIYGYGTWIPYASGRVVVGHGTSTDVNGVQRSISAGSTGGTYEERLSQSQLPAHNHGYKDRYYFENGGNLGNVPSSNKETVGFVNGGVGSGDTDSDNNTFAFVTDVTSSVGGNQPVNNLPPYIACYIWLRTA
jgi:microcystin-dependent protein